jgi:uncharacterized membrane protein
MTRNKILFFFLFIPLLIFGKSYFYPEINTDICFTSDGKAHIIQERTYAFDGAFSWAYVNLKKQGADNIILNEIAEKTDTGRTPIQPLEINDSPQSLYIRWGYSAQDETKTFLLDYTIIGAVKRYQDVAEFYWKVIEDEHEKISNIKINILLPEPSPNLFKVYIHSSAAPGLLTFNDVEDKASIEQAKISEDAFVEVRVLTEPSIFSGVFVQAQNRYEKILNKEKQNFIYSSLRKYVLIPLGVLIIIVLPTVLVLLFYFRYGREPVIPYQGQYEHEPPRKAPPVAVPAILSQKPEKTAIYQTTFRGMFATLLELCTKGFVSIREVKDKHKTHYEFTLEKPNRVSELEPIDREIIRFFFEEISSDGITLTDKALKEHAAKNPTEFRLFLSGLFDQTIDWWKRELGGSLLDPASTKAYNNYILWLIPSVLLGPLLLGIGLSAIGIPRPLNFVLPFLAAIFIFIMFIFIGRVILRWTPSAYTEQKRWLNFKKFITDFSAIEQAPITLLPVWEQYFVYAVALGVAQKFLKNIMNLATKSETQLVLPVWYIAVAAEPTGIASFASSMSNFESFTSNFTSMMSSFSTSAAVGGGFSGGGGGGGGGGGSGAG